MTAVLEIALPRYALGPGLDANAVGTSLDDFIASSRVRTVSRIGDDGPMPCSL